MKSKITKGFLIITLLSMIINECYACPDPLDIEFEYNSYYIPVNIWHSIYAKVIDGGPIGNYDWEWDIPSGLVINGEPSYDAYETYASFSSDNTGDYTISIEAENGTGGTDSDSANVHIYELSITSDNRYIAVNNDDDNNNGTPDCQEMGVDNEDDLIAIHLDIEPGPINGVVWVRIPENSDICIWSNDHMDCLLVPNYPRLDIEFPASRFPSTVYVEATDDSWSEIPIQFGYYPYYPKQGPGHCVTVDFSPIKATINQNTPEYVSYPAEMDISYQISMTSGESPDSVKFYIKDDDTIIMQDNLPAVAGDDIYNWDGGTTVGPGTYTMEIEVTKNGIKHSDTHDFTVMCECEDHVPVDPVIKDGHLCTIGDPYTDIDVLIPADDTMVVAVGEEVSLSAKQGVDIDCCILIEGEGFKEVYDYVKPYWSDNTGRDAGVVFIPRYSTGTTWTAPDTPGVVEVTATWYNPWNNFYFDDDNIVPSPIVSRDITVVEVEYLIPDVGIEIDDGDSDPDTTSFAVSIADTGVVTVTAVPNPSVSEENLPDSWSFTGSTTVNDLVHTVDRTITGITEFTCTCGTSSKTLTVYVYEATLRLYADEGDGFWPPFGDTWGHSWWSLGIDHKGQELFNFTEYAPLKDYLGIGGWWPTTVWQRIPPYISDQGKVEFGEQGHTATGQREYRISFLDLVDALGIVEYINNEENEVQWQAFSLNCTDMAIFIGEQAGVETLDTEGLTTPADLSDFLNGEP